MSSIKHSAFQVLQAWLVLALLALLFYALFARPVAWQVFYFDVWLLGFGLPLWIFRRQATVFLRKWKWGEGLKFVLLAYGAVLLEEIFAALFNHLTEGFNWKFYLIRVGQFWAFNVLAFSGLIGAVGLLYRKVGFTFGEMFVLVGLTGLFSEKVIYILPTAPVIFAVLAPVIFCTYGLIISPALMSVPSRAFHRFASPVRYALFFATWFGLTFPCILLLALLRSRYPAFFPPTKFIP